MNLRRLFFIAATAWFAVMVSCSKQEQGIRLTDDMDNCRLVERNVRANNMGSCTVYDIDEVFVDTVKNDTIYKSYVQSAVNSKAFE